MSPVILCVLSSLWIHAVRASRCACRSRLYLADRAICSPGRYQGDHFLRSIGVDIFVFWISQWDQ